jgi:two-component system cell cycle sensor histidine kinase/response regulator CckA
MIDDPNHPPPNDARPTDIPVAFHKTEKLLAALLETASQAILMIDRAGRMVLANRRAGEMFGYTTQELLGAGIELLVPESKRAAHGRQREDYFQRPRARPAGIGLDLSGRRKDGAEFPVEVSLSFVETEEGIFGIAFISDISVRKDLEEQLRNAQKMEAVGRLAGGVAHDFNNMLTVIAGYNRMILDELSTMDPLRGYAEEILKAAERAGALTNQLLAFSHRQIMQPRVINLNAVIGQTENMLRRLIGEDIQLVMKPGRRYRQHPDRSAPHRAGHCEPGGKCPRCHAPGRTDHHRNQQYQIDETYAKTHMGVQPGEFVMIAVSDTGHGMDSATRQKIFEPFFTTKPRGKGTGLGLATVYGMVKQSGGDIWVYSEPGQGTTFKLYFPRVAEPVSPGSIEEPERARRDAAETLLLVEDETQVRDLEVRMLSNSATRSSPRPTGKKPWRSAGRTMGKISLLVTDVVMPNMSGKQVAEALLSRRPDLKVLYLSGYTENTIGHHGVWTPAWTFSPSPSPGKLWPVRSAKSCPAECLTKVSRRVVTERRCRRRIAYNQRSGSRHMTESGTDSTTLTWSVPECPFTIESSARVLDDIRLAVTDAFFSLPRGGAEIGGILLGTFDQGRLVISDYAALDCEHAYGPSFVLSPPDEARLRDLQSSYANVPGGSGRWAGITPTRAARSFCPTPIWPSTTASSRNPGRLRWS